MAQWHESSLFFSLSLRANLYALCHVVPKRLVLCTIRVFLESALRFSRLMFIYSPKNVDLFFYITTYFFFSSSDVTLCTVVAFSGVIVVKLNSKLLFTNESSSLFFSVIFHFGKSAICLKLSKYPYTHFGKLNFIWLFTWFQKTNWNAHCHAFLISFGSFVYFFVFVSIVY